MITLLGTPHNQILDFSHTPIGYEGYKELSRMLKTNKTWIQINLSHNELGDDACRVISEAFKINKFITHIDLSHNPIGSGGFKAICKMLKTNETLIQIDLSHNIIGNRGAIKFSKALYTNKTLKQINLKNNHISMNGCNAIFEALLVNTSLIQIYLDDYSNIIQEKIKEIDFLLYCNQEWNAQNHHTQSETFKSSIQTFLFSLKRKQKETGMKIPKFVVFEIIKMIDRKAYLHLEFAGNEQIINPRKRKQID